MDQEDGLTSAADQPVIREVQHDPFRWNSLGPKALAEMIGNIAEDSGLDKEIVYILVSQGWAYTYKTPEANSHWTKTDGN